jgi:hypothetical protein
MNKLSYPFYPIPKAVFENLSLSPCAKLLFIALAAIEQLNVNYNNHTSGTFFHCYLHTLANRIGRGKDSVRKDYIPELINAGYIEKKTVGITKGDSHSSECLFRIKWEDIISNTQSL